MKKTIYISGIIVINLILFGSLFKLMHWPGAGVMITTGFVLFSLWILPASLLNHYKGADQKKKKWVYITVFLVVAIDFIGALFKIQHWPGASILFLIGILIPFAVFLPVYIYHHNKDKNASARNFLAVILLLIYVAVLSVFLALTVSKNILDNLVLTGNQLEKSNQYLHVVVNPGELSSSENSQLLNKANAIYTMLDASRQALIDLDYKKEDQKPGVETFDVSQVMHKDDIYLSFFVMLNDEHGMSRSEELKKAIEEFRTECLQLAGNETDKAELIQQLLSTENAHPDPQNQEWYITWEGDYFRRVQLVSVFNNLSTIERNVRMATLVALRDNM